MAARGRGLRRALSAWPCPARRPARWEATGRLKPEYDAVVIGAGKAAEPELRAGGQLRTEAWRDPSPTVPVFWAQAGQEGGQKGAGAVVEATVCQQARGPGAGSGADWLGGLEQILGLWAWVFPSTMRRRTRSFHLLWNLMVAPHF